MTAFTIKRALDRTLAQIPSAAVNGQAACEALLSDFFVELARDAADRVHLELAHRGEHDGAVIENVGSALIQALSETLEAYGVERTRWATEAKALTTTSYYSRLGELGVSPRTGGRA